MKKLIFIFAILCAAQLSAQTYQIDAATDPSPVIRTNVRKLPEAARTKDTVLPAPKFNYGIQSHKVSTSFELDTIKAAKMGSEPLQKLYRAYAKVGVGNYSSLMGEFNLMSTRSKTGAWGLGLGHYSAGSGPKNVAGEFAGFSTQHADIFGKRYLKKHELSGDFGFDRNVVYNYGSPVEANTFTKDFSRQKYNFFEVNGGLKSFYSDSEMVNHNIRVGYNHFDNRFGVTEDRVMLNAVAGRYIRTEYLDADFGVDYNRVSGLGDTSASTIVHFNPRFTARGKKIHASAGLGIYHETNLGGGTYFYPQAYFSYDIVNHIIIPYISLSGRLDRNNYHSLAATNPFVMSGVATGLRNTQRMFELEAGLKGSLSAEIFYQVSASRYELKNMPLFVNTVFSQDVMQNKFNVIYDGADVVHIGGQLGWQKLEKIKVIAGGDWYQYKMDVESHPWHTPTLRLNLIANYNIQDKIIARAEVYFLNGQYARTGSNGVYNTINLKGVTDVNLGFEYRYNKFLSLYVDLRNVANQRYQRWYGYPTQKFNFMAGLTYTF
jgi:hypothetical protein